MVLLIMSIMGVLYVALYYMTGLICGLYYALIPLSVRSFFKYILPITVIIIASEIIRRILVSQESKGLSAFAFLICFVGEVLISSTFKSVRTFNQFADLVGYTVFPAVTANVLYHYLSRRYGSSPCVIYRLITTLFPYVIPYTSQLSAAIYSFARLAVPLLIYMFIDMLYEKKRRYAVVKNTCSAVAFVATLVLMISFVMLISCQFRYRMIVIATGSMEGEINKGDAVIYEEYEYDKRYIQEQDVVVFRQKDRRIVHRVVSIEYVDGVLRYYTKGDANEDLDAGYITDADIEGVVLFKISYFGQATLWLKDAFKR
jgi:signal peptidase